MIAGFGIQFKYCKQTIDVDNANFGAVAVERKMLQGKPNIISFKKCAKCRSFGALFETRPKWADVDFRTTILQNGKDVKSKLSQNDV